MLERPTAKDTIITPSPWRIALREAVRDPLELLRMLKLQPRQVGLSARAAGEFPMLVTRAFVARMRSGDPADALLRQVLPSRNEDIRLPRHSADPLREKQAVAVPGLIRKYRDRALLLPTEACAVHCRYCFRRHFPYSDHRLSAEALQAALDYIAGQPALREVILSGGDPLMLPDARLATLARRLGDIGHLRRLRVHTRLPIMIPQRVDDNLIEALGAGRLPAVMVVHCNHPQEIDAPTAAALRRLSERMPTLNQSVLLPGINDDAETLRQLSERLFDCGVLPYYLHMPDAVAGGGVAPIGEDAARRLLGEVAQRVPGYLLPRLARETPGEGAKRTLAPILPPAHSAASANGGRSWD